MNAHGMVSNHNKKDNTGNQQTLLCCFYVAGRPMTVIVVVFVDAVLYWTLFMKRFSVIIKTCRLSLIDKLQLFTYRMNLLSTSFCSLQMVQEKKKEHTKYITIWGSWLPAEFIQMLLSLVLGLHLIIWSWSVMNCSQSVYRFILIILDAIFGRLLEWCNKKTC